MGLGFYLECKYCDAEHFSANITHNLNKMAQECGLYECLWRPDENNYVYGKDIIDVLEYGLNKLKSNPKHFKQFNSPNGWGVYKDFVSFVEKVLNACLKYPNLKIVVSR